MAVSAKYYIITKLLVFFLLMIYFRLNISTKLFRNCWCYNRIKSYEVWLSLLKNTVKHLKGHKSQHLQQ